MRSRYRGARLCGPRGVVVARGRQARGPRPWRSHGGRERNAHRLEHSPVHRTWAADLAVLPAGDEPLAAAHVLPELTRELVDLPRELRGVPGIAGCRRAGPPGREQECDVVPERGEGVVASGQGGTGGKGGVEAAQGPPGIVSLRLGQGTGVLGFGVDSSCLPR
ncbi:MAG: hypothetical protein ACRDQW_15995 [Haloechinothrix sp.]